MKTPTRLGGIAVGSAAMVQHGVVLMLIGPVLPDLMREFGVRGALAGLVMSAGSFGFTVGPLVAGRVIDQRGVRAALLAGAGIELAVLAAFGVVPAFAVAVGLNFLTRLGASFVETSVNVLPVLLPPAPGAAQAAGGSRGAGGASIMNMMHAFFGVGALAAPAAIGFLLKATGWWRGAFWGGALVTAALLAMGLAVPLPRPAAGTATRRPAWGGIVRDPFVLAGALALFLYVGAEVGMSGWIVLYLREGLGLSPLTAPIGLTLLWLGITVGRAGNSLLARWIGIRALVLGAALGGAACGVALLAARSIASAYPLLLLFGLAISGTFPNVMVSVNTRYPGRVGQVTAFLAIASAAGSMTIHPVIGALYDAFGAVVILVVPAALLLLLAGAYYAATRVRRAAAAAA
jgi:fucose permease